MVGKYVFCRSRIQPKAPYQLQISDHSQQVSNLIYLKQSFCSRKSLIFVKQPPIECVIKDHLRPFPPKAYHLLHYPAYLLFIEYFSRVKALDFIDILGLGHGLLYLFQKNFSGLRELHLKTFQKGNKKVEKRDFEERHLFNISTKIGLLNKS